MRITRTGILVSFLLSLLLLSLGGGAMAQSPFDPIPAEEGESGDLGLNGAELSANVSLLLPYQGRLTTPGSGQPVLDGDYTMTFSLYNVDAGGSALWTETKPVSVVGGLFSTNLGDSTPLSQNQLNGQGLWLGIKVGADAEAAPRIPILPAVYAFSLVPGASLKAPVTGSMVNVTNMGTASSSNGILGITSSTTSGASGVRGVAGSTGLTPSNVVGVTGESASGYGVYGMSNTGLAVYGYSQGSYGVYGAGMGSGAGVFGGNWGTGYGGHFQKPGGTAVYANGGVIVTENLQVGGQTTTGKVVYSSARTHYLTLPGEAFLPGSSVSYANSYGSGGAYISSGSGALVAPVNLPDGAVVTSLRAYFRDTSAADITVYLRSLSYTAGGYSTLASVTSKDAGGYMSGLDSTISGGTINNNGGGGYLIYAWSDSWSSSLSLMGVTIGYTVSEAE